MAYNSPLKIFRELVQWLWLDINTIRYLTGRYKLKSSDMRDIAESSLKVVLENEIRRISRDRNIIFSLKQRPELFNRPIPSKELERGG